MQDVVIVAATRTPIGSFHGALAPLSAVELGSVVIRSLLEKTAVARDCSVAAVGSPCGKKICGNTITAAVA